MSPTDPEAYAWPDYTDLVGRIRELEATLSRVRGLADEWAADRGILSPDSRYTRDVLHRELLAALGVIR